MTKSISLPRTVRGKRPGFFETPGVDDAIAMVMILAQEVAVLRERLDSAERVAAAHGIPLAADIETLPLDEALLKDREQWRQDFYDRLFYLAKQRRAELEQKHSEESYRDVLDKVARGDI
jgi:hypothetical protein